MPRIGTSQSFTLVDFPGFGPAGVLPLSCELRADFDPNPANNTWSGEIGAVECIRAGQ
jgi:hypothetical protein